MYKHYILLALLACCGATGFSQNIDSLLELQRKADPQEKVYVQFDKSYYNPGETIWFKAYLFTGIEPSVASKTFYADLLDADGNLLAQKTAPVAFSGAAGSFDLDSSFAKAAVYFRGYTIAMLNSDTTFLYTKAIRVLSPKAPAPKATPPAPPMLTFLPEGGHSVNGLASTVAFIVTNSQGLPVAITGTVTDNAGAKVADLVTLHDGMGSFVFTPQEGKTYTATWKAESGKSYTTLLPAAQPTGVTLKIAVGEGSRRFVILRSADVPPSLKKMHLAGYMNQHLVFQANVDLVDKPGATGVFSTADLPSGILQITLFDENYKPVAERVTFVNNHDYEFDGDVYVAQKDFGRRGLNKVEVTVSDTIPTNLSLAITDADLVEADKMDDNIITRMLLTGELRGRIVDPYYYFFSTDENAAVYLDLVMLTHGWRRYNWGAVMAGITPERPYHESNYLSLNGQLAGLPPGSYSADLKLMGFLQTADSAQTFVSLPVDRKGNVFTEGLLFYDKAKLFFNFNKNTIAFDKSMLMLDNGLRKGYKKVAVDSMVKRGLPEVSAAAVAANQANNRLAQRAGQQLAKKGMLEAVTVKAKVKTPKEKMEEKYVGPLFSGDGNSFDLLNDPVAGSYMDIFQYLQGKVAGLQITTGGGNTSLGWRGGTPALYLNEMQTDVSQLSSTPVTDIAYIKVFRPGESIVSGGGGGVIAIYTRKGGDVAPNTNFKGLSAVQVAGYSPVKEFYSPDYATPSERDGVSDVRSTLYWNPSIYTDKSRRHIRLQFYNNDLTKRFRLVLEGFNTDGKLIHVEKIVSQQ